MTCHYNISWKSLLIKIELLFAPSATTGSLLQNGVKIISISQLSYDPFKVQKDYKLLNATVFALYWQTIICDIRLVLWWRVTYIRVDGVEDLAYLLLCSAGERGMVLEQGAPVEEGGAKFPRHGAPETCVWFSGLQQTQALKVLLYCLPISTRQISHNLVT